MQAAPAPDLLTFGGRLTATLIFVLLNGFFVAAEFALVKVRETRVDTIGGFVVALLGRLPQKGDELDVGGYRARVVAVGRRRVERLRFAPRDVEEGAAEPEPSAG